MAGASTLDPVEGLQPPAAFSGAAMVASDARVRLATLQGDHDAVLRELEEQVQFHSNFIASLRVAIEAGTRAKGELFEPEVFLEQAKIRLAEAKRSN